MKGTLHKTEEGWVVRYNQYDEPYDRELKVSEISLTNEYLSTYWVEGREVRFYELNLPMKKPFALIYTDDETWDDILKHICDQDLLKLGDVWEWLKNNYEVPKRK